METSGALAGSLVGMLLLLILYGFIFASALLSALGIFRAGTGFYQKVKNNTRATLYDKTFNVYREYSNIIFNYITLINAENNFDLNNPLYKEAKQKICQASVEAILLADDNVRLQINHFLDYSFDSPKNQEAPSNINDAKKEFLSQLFNLQKAIKNHLDDIKPIIT